MLRNTLAKNGNTFAPTNLKFLHPNLYNKHTTSFAFYILGKKQPAQLRQNYFLPNQRSNKLSRPRSSSQSFTPPASRSARSRASALRLRPSCLANWDDVISSQLASIVCATCANRSCFARFDPNICSHTLLVAANIRIVMVQELHHALDFLNKCSLWSANGTHNANHELAPVRPADQRMRQNQICPMSG